MDSLIGKVLSHYKIMARIGSGGMGEIYLADDARLKRLVAVKILPSVFTAERERLIRFEQEARAASALNHPNIITIYDIGLADGVHFIVTEHIEGRTLREKMDDAKMTLPEVLETAIQLASALNAAHEVGIVHRDVKPANIMLRSDGYVKLLDFGLAKLTEQKIDNMELDGATLGSQTKDGVVMGSVYYMSPEQVRGQPADGRADIFALGIVLYEMICARSPFPGQTISDVMAAILQREPPPLSQPGTQIPSELHRIVKKMLKKDRDERYQTAKDLLLDLKTLKQDLEFESRLKQAPVLSVMQAIQIRGLAKDYLDRSRGIIHAVNGISLECAYGEIVGLLGPNGAGKTTALRMLATVMKPTRGEATIAGFDIARDPLLVRKKLGFLTGGTGLYGRLTPVEHLRFFGKLHDMPEARVKERIDELVRLFSMDSFKNSPCDKLSTGQRQRVNLARTLLHEPPVIILDEPTAGLDIISSQTILDFIRNSKKEGKCILFSTHYLTEAELLCDRVAIIHDGKILACDTIEGLKAETQHDTLVDVFVQLIQQHHETPAMPGKIV